MIYQLLISELIDLAKSIRACVSLVQIGSISHPGLSDLDVIFLYDRSIVNGSKIETYLKTIRNKYPKVPLDVWHIPFEQYGMYQRIFYVSNAVLLWGQDSKKNIESININHIDRVMLFLLQTPVKVLRISELLSYSSNPRLILLLLSSLRHSIELCIKSFASGTDKIKLYYILIENLRDAYLSNEIDMQAYQHVFNLFSEIWNDLMLEFSDFININLPEIKATEIKDVYHPVSASGICCFKSTGAFTLISKFKPNFFDLFLSKWFGETIFGISIVELPMEALFFLINFKNKSNFLGRNMFFYSTGAIYKYSKINNVRCDQAEYADKIYSFYKKNYFTKGFPVAHYYDVGINKKIKKVMGKYKTVLIKKNT